MIGTKMVELRKSKGWTQQDLSEKTGIPRSMISRYELNFTTPGKKNLRAILHAFDLPEEYFYGLAVESKGVFSPLPVPKDNGNIINDLLSLPKKEQRIVFAIIRSLKEKYVLQNQLERN